MEILKPMITDTDLEIRSMGRDKVTKHVCCNFFLNSNHKDALKLTKNDRRFAPFYTAQQSVEDLTRDGMDGDYFPNLYAWLRREGFAIVTEYLQNYAIPDELNPAKECHRAPRTTSSEEAFREGLGTMEQEIEAAVLEDRVGFRHGWISSYYLDILIRDCGGIRIPRNKRREILEEMGYIAHPGLPHGGQVNNAVQPDGCKPRLFVKKGHAICNVMGAAEVARKYSEDQTSNNPFRIAA